MAENLIIEAEYPLEFRSEDSVRLGEHIKNRHSIVFIGMKRVGISNFLRFFLNHKEVKEKYIADNNSHLFISVDLNDLIEREIFPFWMLTLKRIADAVINSNLNPSVKKQVENLFLDSIQSKDLFLLIDNIRHSINKIIEAGILPTIFFIRFDRMRDHATREFLYNLEGLKESSHHKLAYVFTTYRRLDHLTPRVFNTTSLNLASINVYLKPAYPKDTEIIAQAYISRYNLKLAEDVKTALFELVDGYIQYLQLSLIILNESEALPSTQEALFKLLSLDERITLQSEELWESLNEKEKGVLIKLNDGLELSEKEIEDGKYLWETGLVIDNGQSPALFSPLFAHFLKHASKRTPEDNISVDFSKKEHSLFSFLQKNLNEICERESIIEAVWPEEEALGVSDWAIDRLVARVRSKLKQQNNEYEIVTVKTRGYKLTSTINA